jgi:hypothetical protein
MGFTEGAGSALQVGVAVAEGLAAGTEEAASAVGDDYCAAYPLDGRFVIRTVNFRCRG